MKRIVPCVVFPFVLAVSMADVRAADKPNISFSTGDEPLPIPRMAVDPAPKSIVFAIAFSPDGKQIALACEDKVVRIHDWPSGKQRAVLAGHAERVWTAAFSPDGKTIASCTGEYRRPEDPAELKIWDLTTGKVKATLEGHKGLIFDVIFSPDGKTLLSAGWDGTVRLWSVATGKELAVLTDHKGPVRSIVFAPGGKTFATGSFDGTARLWDAATAKPLKTLNAHESGVQRVLFSPDGKHLATTDRSSGSVPGEIKLWDLTSGEEVAKLTGLKGSIMSIDFSPDGAMLAIGGGKREEFGEVKLLELASGQVRATLDGHKEWVEGVRFTPDGRTLVSAGGYTRGQPGEVRAWTIADLRQRKKKERPSAERVQTLWNALADKDAVSAYQAVLEMSAAPADSVPFLKEKLRPAVAADPKRIANLIAKLDDDEFDVREEATRELEKVADLARLALKKAHEETKSAEVKRRTETLLRGATFSLTSSELLRAVRAVEILEAAATPEAKQLLESLAMGAPAARLSEQARSALERIKQRTEQRP